MARRRLQDVLEPTVQALSATTDDALSKADAVGFPRWDDVVEWTGRTKDLVLHQRQASAVRAQLGALAERLCRIVEDTPLPPGIEAEAAVAKFVSRLPAVRALLAEDVEAALEGDPAARGFAEIVAGYPSIHAVAVYRLAHELVSAGVPVVPRIMTEHSHSRTGIDIHPGARIGRRFFIDHGTGVVIGETTEIGDRVQLYQGVTLGALSPRRGDKVRGTKRHPTIEDDVTIYAGTTILGGDTVIGRGSVIGGNVWLTHSVAPGTRVLIEAPRQLVREGVEPHEEPDQLDWDI